MYPEKSFISNTRTILVLAFSVIFCSFHVIAEEPDQFFSDLPRTNTINSQSTPDRQKVAKLSDFLQLKDLEADNLSSTEIQEPDSEEQLRSFDLTKRVFCNGFTGCGGRFRGRRRMPEQGELSISKRPFCNSYGCYNSGKKRLDPALDKIAKEQQHESNVNTLEQRWPWLRIKKLFCNGYGGCQNMGKRLTVLSSDVSKDDASLRLLPSFSKYIDSGGKKRFISSDFDSEVDSLIDSLRR